MSPLLRRLVCFLLGHYFLWDPRTATWEDYVEQSTRCYRCGRTVEPLRRKTP